MTKIGAVNSIIKKTNLVKTRDLTKKVALPIAGLTGISLLKGASGGPSWQFEGVKPRGDINLIDHKDSIDNTLFESLQGRIEFLADETGLTDLLESTGDELHNFGELIHDGLADWQETIVETLSEIL